MCGDGLGGGGDGDAAQLQRARHRLAARHETVRQQTAAAFAGGGGCRGNLHLLVATGRLQPAKQGN